MAKKTKTGSQAKGRSKARKSADRQVQDGVKPEAVAVQPRGGQTVYTEAIAEKILERLMYGEGLNTICKAHGMPAESTVRLWVIDDREGFAAKYTRARGIGMDAAADRLRERAKQAAGLDAAGVSAVALEINTEKWYLSKIAPKTYGDKLDLTSGGKSLARTRVIRPGNGAER